MNDVHVHVAPIYHEIILLAHNPYLNLCTGTKYYIVYIWPEIFEGSNFCGRPTFKDFVI